MDNGRDREEQSSPLLYWMGMFSVDSSCSLRTPMSNGLPLLPGQEWRGGKEGERKRERKCGWGWRQERIRHITMSDTHTLTWCFFTVEVTWHPILLCYSKQNITFLTCSQASSHNSFISLFHKIMALSLSLCRQELRHPPTYSNPPLNCVILNITQVNQLVHTPLGFAHRSWRESLLPCWRLISCGLLLLVVDTERCKDTNL